MVTLESFLPAQCDMKSKELELTRQFYEKQMELLKSLKSSFYPENEDPLSNSQLYPTPNTSFTLSVSELHSIIPLGRTAGALREGWTGIMRDHLRRIIPHTTWYFKRSAFSHPDTRKRAAPLFKCEAVCAERTCPNTIKMCATKSDPLRVNVKFGQAMCIHTLRRRVIQTTLNNLECDAKHGVHLNSDCKVSKLSLKQALSCVSSTSPKRHSPPATTTLSNRTPVLHCPPQLVYNAPTCTSNTAATCTSNTGTCTSEIKRPVAVRITPEDRKRSYCRLRSSEDQDAPSAFHIVTSPNKRTRVEPALFPSPSSTLSNFTFNVDLQKPFKLERGIAT